MPERAPTRMEIEAALADVTASGHVPADSQLASFLAYVVTKTLDGEAGDIKAYSIAVDALGKPEDFDPQSNAAVRVMAGRLRKALALHEAEAREGDGERVRITLPTGTYVPTFERLAAPPRPAPVDVADPASRRDEEPTLPVEPTPTPDALPTAPPPARLDRAAHASSVGRAHGPAIALHRLEGRDGIQRSHFRVAAVVLAALAFIIVGAFFAGGLMADWREEQRVQQIADLHRLPSIAVTVTASGGDYPRWFRPIEFVRAVDTTVARFDDYIHYGVIASGATAGAVRDRVLPNADYHLSLAPIADERSVRVYGSLTRMKDRTTVWSGVFRMARPRPKRSDTLERVGRMISPLLAPYGALYSDLLRRDDTRPALRCLLLGYRYFNAESDTLHRRARDCAEDLIERGSRLATLHAMLTFLYLEEHREGRNARSRDPVRAARTVARQALEYGAQSARAHQALFAVRKVSRQYQAARQSGRQAVALNPFDTDIIGDYAAFLVMSGHAGEAREVMVDIEPLWVAKPPWYAFYEFLAADLMGDRDEAIRLARKLDPRASPLAAMGAAIGAHALGDVDEASFALDELRAQEPRFEGDPIEHLIARGMRSDVAATVARKLWRAGLHKAEGADGAVGLLEAPLW